MLSSHLVMPDRFHQKLLNLLTNFEINLIDGPKIQLHQVPMMKVGNGGKTHISGIYMERKPVVRHLFSGFIYIVTNNLIIL